MSRRRVTTLPAPDGKAVGQLVEVGGMMFSSSIAAADPRTGALADGSRDQAARALDNLEDLLGRAGADARNLGLVTACTADPDATAAIENRWHRMFPDAADRPALKVNGYPLPGEERVQLQFVGARGPARHPVGLPGFDDSPPLGVRLGKVVFSAPIDGRDPATGLRSGDRKTQMRQAFRNMEAFVERAGGKTSDLIHVFIFVRSRDDQKDMLDVWLEEFPNDGDRPARKAIFDPTLERESKVIHLMCVAVLGGGGRVNLEVPGITKRHPNPMGCRIGNLVFSSGVGGDDPSGRETDNGAGVRAALALENMRALMTEAGGGLDDVGLVSITVNDYADEAAILGEWRRVFPDAADEPARHVMAFGGRGSYPVQLHVAAAMD